jgi:hypothetical protein
VADPKTLKNTASVTAFVNAVADPDRRRDCKAVMKLMKEATGEKPSMWGASIIGYGSYDYRYANGKPASMIVTGLSPRARNLTLYIMSGFETERKLLSKLGKHKTGKACLYINNLDEVDPDVLRTLIEQSVAHVKARHDGTGQRA